MKSIELVWSPSCTKVKATEGNLREAMALAGLSLSYTPWMIGDDLPQRLQGYSSPTILIDGNDVGPGEGAEQSECRGLPSVDQILAVLRG
mgnify:CR=1 FL=1|jgi:hypothetical protein